MRVRKTEENKKNMLEKNDARPQNQYKVLPPLSVVKTFEQNLLLRMKRSSDTRTQVQDLGKLRPATYVTFFHFILVT